MLFLNKILSLTQNQILAMTFIVIGSVIIFAVLVALIYIFIFSRSRYKKIYRDLERKFQYLDSLLQGQDAQYVHRLQIISNSNLLYVDTYNSFMKRYQELLDGDDFVVRSMLKQLDSLISNKQFKNIKNFIDDTKKSVLVFEEKINGFDSDLKKVIKPEEDSRQRIIALKEKYRSVKQKFMASSNDLELVCPSFNKVFNKLDTSFEEFDALIDSAKYAEANELVPDITKIVNALNKQLDDMPNLCVLIQDIIPQKMANLDDKYHSLEMEGYPLYHLSYNHYVDKWNDNLRTLKDNLISLRTKGINEECDNILKEIENLYNSLLQEVEDEKFFIENNTYIYKNVINLENSFLHIISLMPDLAKTYKINDEKAVFIENLKNKINELGSSKRILETFIHSSTKQPFSSLRKKLETLLEDYKTTNEEVEKFKSFIRSLKKTSEEAFSLIYSYYYRCKQIESIIRNMHTPLFTDQFKSTIDDCYNLLNDIDSTLKITPIDVDLINEKVSLLKETMNPFFDEIENKYREEQLAESAIVYSNRDRNHQANVHQQISMLEQEFFLGHFEKVYHEANKIYKANHVEENN